MLVIKLFIAKDFCKSNLRSALGLSLVHFVVVVILVVVVVIVCDCLGIFCTFLESIALGVSLALRIRHVACTCVLTEATKVNEYVEWTQNRVDSSDAFPKKQKNRK